MCTDESERLCKRGLGFTYCKKLKTSRITFDASDEREIADWIGVVELILNNSLMRICYEQKHFLRNHHDPK